MPKKLTEKNREYFSFSVATKIGISSGGFGELMNKIVEGLKGARIEFIFTRLKGSASNIFL